MTGSRNWDDARTIRSALDGFAASLNEPLTIVHGACPNGADVIADMWVRAYSGPLHVTAERHPPLWSQFGKRAGRVRNEQMVATRPDVVFGFVRDNSPGTTHCVETAIEAGLHVRVWHYRQPGVEDFSPTVDPDEAA